MNENYLKQLGDQIALTHWAQSNEKTYEEICDRVVNYICDDQSEEGRNYNKRMKELLKSKKFIPNSPCWINSGTDMKNLFACYVIDLKDNMNSIMDAAKRMAMIMKEGGGVGVSLTPIRAEGARVGGEGSNRTASGPISFLKVFDSVVGAVKSAGVRRGAALANLKTGHPDIIKFIKCKEDQNQINNFNLSVAITDKFMDDVINKSTREWAEDDEAAYTASDIYDMIVEHMWRNGEPGVQFIDTVNNVDGKYTGRPEFREFNTGIEVSNPCVTGETVLMTKEGNFPIRDLVGKEVQVWNGKKWSKVIPFTTGENTIYKISITASRLHSDPNDEGNFDPNDVEDKELKLFCTPYHKFILDDGTIIQAQDLTEGNLLKNPETKGSWDEHWDYYSVTGVENTGCIAETFCLTEPEEHAMTLLIDGVPVLTSQCGESFLKPNEACNLASINLYHFVYPFWDVYKRKEEIDQINMALRQELKQTVEDAVDFLNLMLDKSETPFEEINEAVHQSRKVGLGVMGLADYLSAKGIVYGSPEAIHEAADIFAFISKTAEEYSLRKGYKNACLTIQAPTGTTGLVGEVSTGIEPHFLRCWTRHSLKMGDLLMYPKSLHDYIVSRSESCRVDDPHHFCWVDLEKAMENNDMERFSDIIECNHETVTQANLDISNEIKCYWPTAHEVTPKQHLAMLAAIQRHVHNSVSKTINLPHDATVDDVRELITTAWRSGCKGFTCYRDGSRDSQPLKSIEDTNNNIVGSVFTDKLGHSLLIQDTGDNLIDSLEYCNIRCDVGNVEFVLKPVSGMEEVKAKALKSAKKLEEITKSIENGETVFIPKSEYDELLKRADILEKLNDSVDFDLETAKEVVSEIRSGKFTLVPVTEYDKMREALLTVTRFEDDIAKLPPEYLPKNSVKNFAKDFAEDNSVLSKSENINNAPCKRPRPDTTYGETVKTKIGCGSIYITVNKDENGTCEVFTNLGRAGGCPSQSEATSRLISLALRSGVKVEDVIDQLKGIRCMNTMRQGGIKQSDGTVVLSCPDAIGKAIEKFHKADMEDGLFIGKMRDCTPEENASIEKYIEKISVPTGINIFDTPKCPECGKELTRDGGCIICRHCGYSKCG